MVVCFQAHLRKMKFQFLLRIHPASLEARPHELSPIRVLVNEILLPNVPASRPKSTSFAQVALLIHRPPSHDGDAHQGLLTMTQAPDYHHFFQVWQLRQFGPPVPIALLGVPQNSKARSKIDAQFCDESAYARRHRCESVARAPRQELAVLEEARLCFLAELSADHRYGNNFGEVNFKAAPTPSSICAECPFVYADEVGDVQEIAEDLVPDLAWQAEERRLAAVELGAVLQSGSNIIS